MEKEIIKDIVSGMFIVSTNNSACIVDTVLQVSASAYPLISVCINKNNYTNKKIKENKKFIVSILDENVDGKVIETFGFKSSRDVNKFDNFDFIEEDGIKILKDAIGYFICELTDIVDTDTHNIFIGRVIKQERFKDSIPMTYQYYLEHKDKLLKVKTEKNKTAYVCTMCNYVYYGDTLPDGFICPICGYSKEYFEKK